MDAVLPIASPPPPPLPAEGHETTACMPADFIGDGDYMGDGGRALQVLWELYRWKPIPRCPGRYVSPDRGLRDLDVEAVVHQVQERSAELSESALAPSVAGPMVSLHIPDKDPIQTARFLDGGGLFTYVKADGVHVHSLNTESGYARKLEALGLDWTAAYFQPPDAEQATARPVERHQAVLHVLITTLNFLQADEKNRGAYPVAWRLLRVL